MCTTQTHAAGTTGSFRFCAFVHAPLSFVTATNGSLYGMFPFGTEFQIAKSNVISMDSARVTNANVQRVSLYRSDAPPNGMEAPSVPWTRTPLNRFPNSKHETTTAVHQLGPVRQLWCTGRYIVYVLASVLVELCRSSCSSECS